jgi:DNA-binding cell septation regulator SpoVG
MEITELKIFPNRDQKFPLKSCLADCIATFESGLKVKHLRIMEGKKGIYVRFPGSLSFETQESKKQITNRILATYVINHCIDDYGAQDPKPAAAEGNS